MYEIILYVQWYVKSAYGVAEKAVSVSSGSSGTSLQVLDARLELKFVISSVQFMEF